MDTYENNDIPSEPIAEDSQSEQPQQEQAEQQPQQGFYHGLGTGSKEAPYSYIPYYQVPPYYAYQQPPYQPPAPKKKWLKKTLLRLVAAVGVIALVTAGCGAAAFITNRYWKRQYQLTMKSFNERMDVLQNQIEALTPDSEVTVPVEGLTPSQVYQQNIKSVVAISCLVRTIEAGQVFEGESAGSGFILTADGYVVTNHHVVEGATSINVITSDGQTLTAKFVGSNATNDIALLKVEGAKLKPVTVGKSSELRVGDQVVAIGNALGELSFSLTAGYVSGINRDVSTDGLAINMIQTDASINSGNSGGPLFNAKGEVVGITTAKYSGTTASGANIEGIGFAIPMDDVFGMLEDLRQYGYITGAYLGVRVTDVDTTAANIYGLPLGAYVSSVESGYCAQEYGIQTKDIITAVGGYEVENVSDLTRALRNFKAGDSSTVTLWRSGAYKVIKIVFDEKPHS